MAARAPKIIYVASALVVGLTILFGIILYATGQFSRSPPIGGPFKLTGNDGRPVSDETFNGKPYLAFFGYTIVRMSVRRRYSTCRRS